MDEILPKIEGEPYAYKAFPAVCHGPDGANGVFSSEAEVPAGWKLPDGSTKGGKAKAPETPVLPVTETSGEPEIDADGWPWSEDLHATTKTKTSAGLWRMKVGVSRPAPKTLDL